VGVETQTTPHLNPPPQGGRRFSGSKYLMELGTVLYLSRKDVETIGLPMREIIDALDAMFKEKGAGRTEMPPKPGVHTRPDAFIHAMPAYIPSLESAGVKWVSGYPGNQAKGLPYITGLLILNDPETGIPLAIMDCTWITAKRTGAATAVAAKYLARLESSTIGIVACGVQGRSNLEALACLFKITKVKAYDLYPEIAERYAAEMSPALNLNIEPVKNLPEAVKGLDIVVTSGPILKNPKPLIEPGWLAPGAFASPVDFDSYWQSRAFREIDKLATDDLVQMRYYRHEGYFKKTPRPYADLGEIAAGLKPGRESPDECTMSINLGLALDDMATAIRIYQLAKAKGIGLELPL
jgi:ornithine cyclodeaminase/alanine dehydrogenase-like protein (mu-crystallin family)